VGKKLSKEPPRLRTCPEEEYSQKDEGRREIGSEEAIVAPNKCREFQTETSKEDGQIMDFQLNCPAKRKASESPASEVNQSYRCGIGEGEGSGVSRRAKMGECEEMGGSAEIFRTGKRGVDEVSGGEGSGLIGSDDPSWRGGEGSPKEGYYEVKKMKKRAIRKFKRRNKFVERFGKSEKIKFEEKAVKNINDNVEVKNGKRLKENVGKKEKKWMQTILNQKALLNNVFD